MSHAKEEQPAMFEEIEGGVMILLVYLGVLISIIVAAILLKDLKR